MLRKKNRYAITRKKAPRVRFELTRPLRVTSYPGEISLQAGALPLDDLGTNYLLAAFPAAAKASLSESFHALG
jgi:hypothetical protein